MNDGNGGQPEHAAASPEATLRQALDKMKQARALISKVIDDEKDSKDARFLDHLFSAHDCVGRAIADTERRLTEIS